MSEHIMEIYYSLREAVEGVKERLRYLDVEEESWGDKVYLVYRNGYCDNEFYLFEDEFELESWLEGKFHEWELWEENTNNFLEEHLTVWKFHRDICKEKWEILYRDSKQFVDGWSRIKESISCELIPSFSIG